MVRKGKEKQVTGKKRKSSFEFRDESYSKKKSKEFRDECLMIKKPKTPRVLQFFEESANVGYYGGSSDEDFTFVFSDLEDKPELEEGTSKDGEYNEKTVGFDASAFGDIVSTKNFPLSPEKEWQPRERYSNSNQGDKGSMYSIGQKLRIRVGLLKGYLCRVIALCYSDVTVKLDSHHKIFTVKSEHLAEVRNRTTVLSTMAMQELVPSKLLKCLEQKAALGTGQHEQAHQERVVSGM